MLQPKTIQILAVRLDPDQLMALKLVREGIKDQEKLQAALIKTLGVQTMNAFSVNRGNTHCVLRPDPEFSNGYQVDKWLDTPIDLSALGFKEVKTRRDLFVGRHKLVVRQCNFDAAASIYNKEEIAANIKETHGMSVASWRKRCANPHDWDFDGRLTLQGLCVTLTFRATHYRRVQEIMFRPSEDRFLYDVAGLDKGLSLFVPTKWAVLEDRPIMLIRGRPDGLMTKKELDMWAEKTSNELVSTHWLITDLLAYEPPDTVQPFGIEQAFPENVRHVLFGQS